MAKRRKRTNANIPAKGRLREMADRLWSVSVRSDWNWKCAVCEFKGCEAHHLIPRQHEATRYDLRNGIALCANHHQFCPHLSPHQNAAGWMAWLSQGQPVRYEWYVETIKDAIHLSFSGTKNAVYYCGVILSFREYVEPDEFEKIVGKAFTKYLVSNLSDDVEF